MVVPLFMQVFCYLTRDGNHNLAHSEDAPPAELPGWALSAPLQAQSLKGFSSLLNNFRYCKHFLFFHSLTRLTARVFLSQAHTQVCTTAVGITRRETTRLSSHTSHPRPRKSGVARCCQPLSQGLLPDLRVRASVTKRLNHPVAPVPERLR